MMIEGMPHTRREDRGHKALSDLVDYRQPVAETRAMVAVSVHQTPGAKSARRSP